MKNSKIFTIALIILFASTFFASSSFAVSAEEGQFVVLGRIAENKDVETGFVDEMIGLFPQPDVTNVVYAKMKSGTTVIVLQKLELETGDLYYHVSTVGRGGGMMGWVTEEYIYEIAPEPEGL